MSRSKAGKGRKDAQTRVRMHSERWESMKPEERIRVVESDLITYPPEMVDNAFGGVNQVSDQFRTLLAKSMSRLPMSVVDWAVDNVLFVSSNEDDYAFFIPRDEWNQQRSLVFLCESLKSESADIQAFYIAHEIAHVRLGHRSPVYSMLTPEEADRQEKDADRLARKWLYDLPKNNLKQ